MKTVLRTLLLAVVLLAVGWFAHSWYQQRSAFDAGAQAAIVQQNVRMISQYATAEGTYSSMFKYADEAWPGWSGLSKRVMVQASARMVMGFDLEGIGVEVNEERRQLIITNWPPPSELAFELDTEFFDLQQGVFNTFEPQQLNKIEEIIEQKIRRGINRDELVEKSYQNADNLLAIIGEQLEPWGWSLIVEDWPAEQ